MKEKSCVVLEILVEPIDWQEPQLFIRNCCVDTLELRRYSID